MTGIYSDLLGITAYGGGHPQSCQCLSCFVDRQLAAPKRPFYFTVELAGVKRANIDVTLKGEFLNIKWTTRLGELKNSSTLIGSKYYDLDKISCTYEDGLLKVMVPLKDLEPEIPPNIPEKKIEIK